jgi:hypothetical protein
MDRRRNSEELVLPSFSLTWKKTIDSHSNIDKMEPTALRPLLSVAGFPECSICRRLLANAPRVTLIFGGMRRPRPTSWRDKLNS